MSDAAESLRGGRGPNPVPAGKAGTVLHHDGRQDAWAEAQVGMVGRIMAPQDVHIVIPRTCECVTSRGKRGFANLIDD